MSRFYRLVGREPMSKSSMQFTRLLVLKIAWNFPGYLLCNRFASGRVCRLALSSKPQIRLFALLFCRMCQGNALKWVPHVQHDY